MTKDKWEAKKNLLGTFTVFNSRKDIIGYFDDEQLALQIVHEHNCFSELVEALDSIATRECVKEIDDKNILKKWIYEFAHTAKKALQHAKETK